MLSRSENIARWFVVVICALITLAAAAAAYQKFAAGVPWATQLVDVLLFLAVTVGVYIKKRFGAALYVLIGLVRMASLLIVPSEANNSAYFIGAIAGSLFPLVLGVYLFWAFGRLSSKPVENS
ncbi:MAG TPA: hypothetical protein VIH99_00610 [Bdellovibrionota bacterium]|jgi:hypothetical protein